jgi:hypothetical protein
MPVPFTYSFLIALPWVAFAVSNAAAGNQANSNGAPTASPSSGKAMVYIFRERQMHGAGERSRVFVNDSLMGILHLGEYSSVEVPQGPTVIVATVPGLGVGALRSPDMAGAWTSLPGCKNVAALDWRKFAAASNDDLRQCEEEVKPLEQTCGPYVPTIDPDTSGATAEDLNMMVTFMDETRWVIYTDHSISPAFYFWGSSRDGSHMLGRSAFFRISDPTHGGNSWVVLPPGTRLGRLNVPTCNYKLTELER